MRTITYTSKDKTRSVVMRERTGRDAVTLRFLHAALAEPLQALYGVDKIVDLPNDAWAQIAEVAPFIQQIVSLDGEWGEIVLPRSESGEDRYAFLCSLLDAPESYIATLQEALKEVNASALDFQQGGKPA